MISPSTDSLHSSNFLKDPAVNTVGVVYTAAQKPDSLKEEPSGEFHADWNPCVSYPVAC